MQELCGMMPVSDPHLEVGDKVSFAGGLRDGGKEGTVLIADRKLDGLGAAGEHTKRLTKC